MVDNVGASQLRQGNRHRFNIVQGFQGFLVHSNCALDSPAWCFPLRNGPNRTRGSPNQQ